MNRPAWFADALDALAHDFPVVDRDEIAALLDECFAAEPDHSTALGIERCLRLVRARLDVRRWLHAQAAADPNDPGRPAPSESSAPDEDTGPTAYPPRWIFDPNNR